MNESEARKLDSPLMIFSLAEESARLGSGKQWASNGRSAITLMKTSDFRIVLIALGLGKIMHEHRAEGPITLLVQQGLIRLKADGLEHVLQREMLVTLGHGITHEIEALEESTFLLTIVQSHDPTP